MDAQVIILEMIAKIGITLSSSQISPFMAEIVKQIFMRRKDNRLKHNDESFIVNEVFCLMPSF
jgi:hypothetical protein